MPKKLSEVKELVRNQVVELSVIEDQLSVLSSSCWSLGLEGLAGKLDEKISKIHHVKMFLEVGISRKDDKDGKTP